MGISDNGQPQSQPLPDSVGSPEVIDESLTGDDVQDGSLGPQELDRAYVEKNGDTMLGSLDMAGQSLLFNDVSLAYVASNVITLGVDDYLRVQLAPVDPLDVANKAYVDSISSPTASSVSYTPYGDISATNVQTAINELDDEKVSLNGDTMLGDLDIASNLLSFTDASISRFAPDVLTLGVNDILRAQIDPVDNNDLTRKSWVDGQLSGKADVSHTHVEADITDLGDYVNRLGDTMAGDLNFAGNQLNDAGKVDIYGLGQVFEVYDSNTDTHPRLAIRGADGALQMGPGGGTAPAIQFQYQSPGQVTFTGIGIGSGTGQFLASTQLISEKLILDPTPTHGAAGTGSVEIDGNTSTPSISLGSGAAAPDWVATRSSADTLVLAAGDTIQVQQDPSVDNDLARKAYVDSQTLFGDNYQLESQTTPLATSSGTYAQFMRLTTPSLPAGTYRIGWRYNFKNSNMGTTGQYKIELDDTTVIQETLLPSAAGGIEQRYSNFATVVLGAGVHTFDIDGRVDSGVGTLTLNNGKIDIWRIS